MILKSIMLARRENFLIIPYLPVGWGVVCSEVVTEVLVCGMVCWESEVRERGVSGVMSP